MKRVVVSFMVVVIAVAGMLATAVPVGAVNGACGGSTWFDPQDQYVYNQDYRSSPGYEFYDRWQNKNTRLWSDIESWRYTPSYSHDGLIAGHCYRTIRVSGWVDDGSYGTVWGNWRVWVCNSLREQAGSAPVFAGGFEAYLWNVDYSGCGGPQADTSFHGQNGDWSVGELVPSSYVNL